MSVVAWIGIAVGLVCVGIVLYWLLIITEGTYLGQPIVTWMYDVVAKRYDGIKGFDDEIESAYLGRPLAGELVLRRARLVLDIGTGTGRLPKTLLEQQRFQGRVVGIDASELMLLSAVEKLKNLRDRCLLIHRSAIRLPFISNSFDAVTMLEMLEFTPDPAVVLKEAIRVLRPGGLLLTTRRRGFDAWLMPGKTYSEESMTELLLSLGTEEIRVQRWQVDYDLVWARRCGESSSSEFSQLLELLTCLKCGNASYLGQDKRFVCELCGHQVDLIDGIIRMNS